MIQLLDAFLSEHPVVFVIAFSAGWLLIVRHFRIAIGREKSTK